MAGIMAIDHEHETGNDIASRDQLDLSDTQVKGLEKLHELGAEPRASQDEPYDKNPQIRAYQMMAEGKIGGAGRGQGRKSKSRASSQVAEHIRSPRMVRKINQALEDALDDENKRVQLEAVKIAMDLEDKDSRFELDAEKHDAELDNMDKDELIGTLISLAEDSATQAAVKGFAIDADHVEVGEDGQPVRGQDQEEAGNAAGTRDIHEDDEEDEQEEPEVEDAEVIRDDAKTEGDEGNEATPVASGSRNNGSGSKKLRRGSATRNGASHAKPRLTAAKRRATQRRSTS